MSEYTAYFRAQLEGKDAVLNGLRQIDNERRRLDGSSAKLRVDISGIDKARYALSELGQMMQSLGSSLDSFSGLVGDKIGGAFSSMAGMFDTDFMHYAKLWTSKAVTGMFFDNIEEASQRFDILSTYNDYLGIMGVSAEEAQESLDRLNQSIQGLPLGLSDVAFQARRYAMFLGGDIEEATDLTIGMNRALIAGGAPEYARTTAVHEIERLLAVGKLSQSRQWLALLNGLGISVGFLQEEMGATEMTIQDFAEALATGDIATEDFLKGIEALADSENLDKAIEIYKGTLESAISNLHYALIRGKADIIDTFSETLEEITGTNLAGTINKIRDKINEIFIAAQDYIKDRPEMIAHAIETIMGIVDRAKGFDWAGTADKIFTNLGRMLEIMVGMWDRLPEGAVSDFVSFALTWAGPLGKAFQAIQSGLPFMFALFERMKDFDFESLAENIFNSVGRLIGTLVNILNMIPDSTLEKLITFGLVWASPLGKAFSGIGKMLTLLASSKLLSALGALGKVGGAANLTKIGTSLKAMLAGFAGITMLNVSIAEIGLVILEFAKIAESIGKMDFGNFKKNIPLVAEAISAVFLVVAALVTGLGTLHHLTGGVSTGIVGVGALLTSGIFAVIGEVAFVIEKMADAISAIGKANIPSENKVKKLGKAISSIIEYFDIDMNQAAKISNNRTAFDNLSRIVDDVADMGKNLKKIKDLGMSEAAIDRAGGQAKRLVSAVGGIFKMLEGSFANENGTYVYWDETRSSAIVTILDNMNTSVGSLSSIGETINAMTSTLSGLMNDWTNTGTTRLDLFAERIPTFIGAIATMFVDLKDAFNPNSGRVIPGFPKDISELGFASAETSQIDIILGNMTTVLTDLSTIGNTIEGPGGLTAMMTRLTTNYTGEGSRLESFKDNVESFIGTIGNIFGWIKKEFTEGKYKDLFDSTRETGFAATIVSNIENAVNSLKDIAQAIINSGPNIAGLLQDRSTYANEHGGTTYDKNRKPLLTTYVEDVKTMMDSIALMADDIVTNFPDTGKLQVADEALRALQGNDGVIRHLADIMTRLYNMQDKVSDLTGGGGDFELGKGLNHIFGSLKGIFASITEGDGNVYAMEDISQQMLTAVENINKVVAYFGLMGDTTARLTGGGESFVLGDQLGIMFTGLMDAFSGLAGDAGTVETLAGNFDNLAQSFGEVATQAGEAQSGVNDVRDAIDNAASAASGKSGVINGFAGNLNYVGAMARAAASGVNSLAAAINALQSKTIDVTVNYHTSGVVTTGNAFRNNALTTAIRANGGLIYRAGGGFTPRGTDTVPAMLTPGEYVHRRAAVKLFGEEFMSRINNLDLSGALQSLVLRAGSGIIPKGLATVNNTYNRDNHATVNQKIYTNNPNYSFRRANRYVKAL